MHGKSCFGCLLLRFYCPVISTRFTKYFPLSRLTSVYEIELFSTERANRSHRELLLKNKTEQNVLVNS